MGGVTTMEDIVTVGFLLAGNARIDAQTLVRGFLSGYQVIRGPFARVERCPGKTNARVERCPGGQMPR